MAMPLRFYLLVLSSLVVLATGLPRPQLSGFADLQNLTVLSNGMIDVKIGKAGSQVSGGIQGIVFKRSSGLDVEILDPKLKSRAYWDMHWEYGSYLTGHDYYAKVKFNQYLGEFNSSLKQSRTATPTQGISFQHKFLGGRPRPPVNLKVDYTLKQGLSGVYCTLLVEHTEKQVALQLTEIRLVLKLDPKKFDYTYVADDRQRYMPTRMDISKHRSAALAFKEARMLTKPKNRSLLYEVDHKYHYSVEAKDSSLHGWVSTKEKIGVWIISPNKWEYLGGGPNKQDLTVQTGPNLLAMLQSTHYGTPAINLENAERWSKTYGPFLIYANEGPDVRSLIADARARADKEIDSWPYKFVPFPEYLQPEARGSVSGRVIIGDAFDDYNTLATDTWVGLSDQGSPNSSWEDEVRGYQFWNVTDEYGVFLLENVRPGIYVLQSLVRGDLTDSSVLQTVTVKPTKVTALGDILLRRKRKGPTVWEIGVPDRTAAEFFVPDVGGSEERMDSSGKDGFRLYGAWNKFAEMYPHSDPVYTIGKSQWAHDWFFAHVNRPNRTTTQREVRFKIDRVMEGDYTLRLAIAGAHQAALEVRLNNPGGYPLHDTGPFGRDNALARAGIHGHFHEFSISLSHMNFHVGSNALFLCQRKNQNKFSYVMYDYIRLEAPAPHDYETHNVYDS